MFMITALNSQIKVADRPVTQQGLAGMKTGSKGTSIHYTIYIECTIVQCKFLSIKRLKFT